MEFFFSKMLNPLNNVDLKQTDGQIFLHRD